MISNIENFTSKTGNSRVVENIFLEKLHGETFLINFYYSIFQFREKRITSSIFDSKNTKLYNNDMKL